MNFVKLGGLVSVLTGKLDANAASPDGQYPFFTCAREPLRISSWSYDMDAVLVAGNGDLNVKYYNGKFDAYQRTYILSPKDGCNLDARYLYHFMEKYLDKLRSQSIGGIIKYIKLGMITEAVIPLPPLSEQKRIAAILDKADQLRQRRKQAIALLDSLTQSIFLEMFGDPVSNPKAWPIKAMNELTTSRLGKMLDQKKMEGLGNYSYLANLNVQWNRFELANLRKMGFSVSEREEFLLKYGDLLVCEGGEIGRSAIWRNEMPNCYYQKALHRIRCDPSLCVPEYLLWFFWFMAKRGGLAVHTSVATIPHLTGAKLKSLKVPTPPLELQNKFAQVFNTLNLELNSCKLAQNRIEALFASLQHRAFSGQL